ncbi:hypothetical protein [Paraburkholderia nemoris]|uniref:hypothetical protein n=1 Tax=Paraburkholderia nemoris TaxID=2793076 RepID=UPI0038BD585E
MTRTAAGRSALIRTLPVSLVPYLFFVALPAYRGTGLVRAADTPRDGAEGLEWTVPSPTPFHTFEMPPMVE